MTLEDVLAPMTVREFVRDVQHRRMHLSDAVAGRYAGLLPWDDLETTLAGLRLTVPNPRIRMIRKGVDIAAAEYLTPHVEWGAGIRSGAFEDLLWNGATLVLNAAEDLFTEVTRLVEDVERRLGGAAQGNVYAGWRTQEATGAHYDSHDTLILQVAGRKAWKVYGPVDAERAGEGAPAALPHPPVWEGLLEDGAFLYVPRGWLHMATPVDEPTVHLTVGMVFPTGRKLLDWWAATAESDPIFQEYLPERENSVGQSVYLERVRRRLSNLLDENSVERTLDIDDARTPRRRRVRLARTVPSAATDWTRKSIFLTLGRRVRPSAVLDGTVGFRLDRTQWRCSAEVGEALRRLDNSVPVTFDALATGMASGPRAEMKILLLAMKSAGAILMTDMER